jgi:hypothetical protein
MWWQNYIYTSAIKVAAVFLKVVYEASLSSFGRLWLEI